MGFLAAIPGILGAAGAGASAIGGMKSAFGGGGAGGAGIQAVFPGLQKEYLQALPQLGKTAMGTMGEMARTGMPTDVGPMFESILKQRERGVEQGRGNILSQFGQMGLRYSTPMANALVDYESQVQSEYGNILANYVFQAMEAARTRQMQASTMGVQAYGQPALAMTGQQPSGSGWSSFGESLATLGGFMKDIKWTTPTSPAIPNQQGQVGG